MLRKNELGYGSFGQTLLSQSAVPFGYAGYGKSELNVEKKRRALSEAAERRELVMDYRFLMRTELQSIMKASKHACTHMHTALHHPCSN